MESSVHFFDDQGDVPNNQRFPVIIYRNVVEASERDFAEAFEHLFSAHQWAGLWRNGIYPFHHYHSTAHEVLGIASGSVMVRLGGEGGESLELHAGDAVLLPAGTGHKRLSSSAGLLVIGGYPRGQEADLIRADDASADADVVRQSIEAVVLPAEDPVAGADGPMFTAWVQKA